MPLLKGRNAETHLVCIPAAVRHFWWSITTTIPSAFPRLFIPPLSNLFPFCFKSKHVFSNLLPFTKFFFKPIQEKLKIWAPSCQIFCCWSSYGLWGKRILLSIKFTAWWQCERWTIHSGSASHRLVINLYRLLKFLPNFECVRYHRDLRGNICK